MTLFFNYNPAKKLALINLKAKPNAKANCIEGFTVINNTQYLTLRVKAIPENGEANKEILAFLAKKWRIPKQDIDIINGHTSRYKILAIKNIEYSYLNSCLSHYIK